MRITLPYPPKELNPNGRLHWAKKHKVTKKYRQDCRLLVLRSRAKITWDGLIHIRIMFYPPDRRRRDDDNMLAAFKAGRDGVADALGVDDSRFRVHPELMDEPIDCVIIEIAEDIKQLYR